MPAPTAPAIQLFGLPDSRATQAALRFFKERRVEVTFVDLRKRPIALGELKRFVERLGAAALLDTEGKQYKDLGLGYMSLDPDQIVARLMGDVRLMRLPLARFGNAFSVGSAETTWKTWISGAVPPVTKGR